MRNAFSAVNSKFLVFVSHFPSLLLLICIIHISFRLFSRSEELLARGGKRAFDAVTLMEIVEHVIDPGLFLHTCAALVKVVPGRGHPGDLFGW